MMGVQSDVGRGDAVTVKSKSCNTDDRKPIDHISGSQKLQKGKGRHLSLHHHLATHINSHHSQSQKMALPRAMEEQKRYEALRRETTEKKK